MSFPYLIVGQLFTSTLLVVVLNAEYQDSLLCQEAEGVDGP